MGILHWHHNQLYIEQTALADLAARFGTPLYVYSKSRIINNFRNYQHAFANHKHQICYALKANSNLAIIQLLAQLGAGFDIVSRGELERVLQAGGDASKVVFSGVGKTENEIEHALQIGIQCFNVESAAELMRINEIAQRLQKKAPISLRVNPDVDAKTHPYIATGLHQHKFGIALNEALPLYLKAQQLPGLNPIGIDCHIGSQLLDLSPFQTTLTHLLTLVKQLCMHGIELQHIDMGGGLGISYQNEEKAPSIQSYVKTLLTQLNQDHHAKELTLLIEPGRSMIGDAGILLTQVEYIKSTAKKNFAIVDAAMNDLLRPALYHAYMQIESISKNDQTVPAAIYDIVGPICESADFLGLARQLTIKEGDILAIHDAGAYGFSMASNYNSRLRPAEVLIDNDQIKIIRQREKYATLWHDEQLL